ncbi:MAG TPA: hypothetical protein VJ994_10840, partial [Paracoccaceae bacterium]|nr:hypothetical protein [Paracoccaceae bacterium]
VGDPSGRVGAAVTSAVKEIVGADPETEAGRDAALAAIEADPSLAAELKARLAELSLAETEAYLADRADARARDVALVEATGESFRRADVMLIAAFAAVVAIAAVMFLLSLNATTENSALVNTLVGFLTGIGGMFARNIGTAFDFEFGSSRSSREKDGRLAGLAARGSAAREGPAAALDAFRRSLG